MIGSGRMGSFHGETLAQRLTGARLMAVADPAPGAAEELAAGLGAASAYTDPAQAFADPAVDAVVIAAPARFHADLIVGRCGGWEVGLLREAGGACRWSDLDRAIDAVRAAGVVLQVGFNRRFAPDWAAARELLDDGTSRYATAASFGDPRPGRVRPVPGGSRTRSSTRP